VGVKGQGGKPAGAAAGAVRRRAEQSLPAARPGKRLGDRSTSYRISAQVAVYAYAGQKIAMRGQVVRSL